MEKQSDIKWGKNTVNDIEQLNDAQYNSLTKDQKEGRAPVKILGKLGYVGGDKSWKSVAYMNKLKKEGKWEDR